MLTDAIRTGMKIKRVLIVGGTHGNELTGVYLIKKFGQYPALIQRSSFETLILLGNPDAVELGVRHINADLNRCFDFQTLKDQGFDQSSTQFNTQSNIEIQRAREISEQFGQEGRSPIDLVIDGHSTTSNSGITLILDKLDFFTLSLSAYLSSIQPALRVYHSATSGRNRDSLRSIAKYGICIEVGPIPNGTLQAELFQKTEDLIFRILDYLEQYNSNDIPFEKTALTVYQYMGAIDYPRYENGEIQAMIHPQLQFKDYEALNFGDPIFLTFDGKTLAYQGDSTVYPIFINEAAYYEKGIAMCLTRKQQIQIRECG
jgi:succinylglutamate desuccinylase